ncbi:hydroxymethylpyrimidine/phosphomethylpyrimidine kinase [Candidatus Hydrogenosomobacter endosymbioticus]|uniref:hydroxymethylpyrimidine kinase n=2 Tax=Candidatus Hydrogenosomobacter endosymbioticus TaxID=2558174 RepID=A0ABN6L390_9PROT|nr:hydroxymethylpyrimidine/phosphomethylpyrimidine kinase [Candidatus Hydrogenosomobacter endosymbioticus]
MTVVTAVTAQNSVGVADTFAIPPDVIIAQLSSIFSDALPTSIKVGMLFSEEIVSAVSEFLKKNAHGIPIVVDPVMVAKSGHFLLAPKATIALKNELIPLATIVTPNLCEAAALVGIEDIRFSDQRELENYAKSILSLGAKSVFLKGGHSANETNSDDFFIDSVGNSVWMNAARITSKNTHGTGCTLSSAIAASIASGHSVTEACSNAKNYVLKAIDSARSSTVWKGHGPVDHFFWMSRTTTSSSRRSLSQASKTNR